MSKIIDKYIEEILVIDGIEKDKAVCCELCGRPFVLPSSDGYHEDWEYMFCTKVCYVEYHKIKLMEEMRS